MTQAAQNLAAGDKSDASRTDLEERLSRLYRRHVSLLGPGYTLTRGDDALLGLAVYVRGSEMDARLRPALSKALCEKSAAFRAALAYVNSDRGPGRAKAIYVNTALAVVFGGTGPLRRSEYWERQRDFHAEIIRLTRLKSDLVSPTLCPLPLPYASYCQSPGLGQPSVVDATRATFQEAIDSAWEQQVTAERIAMRVARALPCFALRRLRDGKSLFSSDEAVLARVESKYVQAEISASISLADKLFWKRERGAAHAVARSNDDVWQILFEHYVQVAPADGRQASAELERVLQPTSVSLPP